MDKLINEFDKTGSKPAINDENDEKISEKAEGEGEVGEEEGEEDESPPDADECTLNHVRWRLEYDKNNYLG